jgi:glycerol-3-phosphate dehydrogenase
MDNPSCLNKVLLSAGTHLTMPLRISNKKYGLLIPETEDGRIVFLLPWLHKTLVGTTERKMEEPELNPVSSYEEIKFLLDNLNNVFTKLPTDTIVNSV